MACHIISYDVMYDVVNAFTNGGVTPRNQFFDGLAEYLNSSHNEFHHFSVFS